MEVQKVKCIYSKKCGGCSTIGEAYSDTLQKKQKYVANLLKPFGKVDKIVGMEQPYNYRNKVHAVVSGDKKGNIFAGTYMEGSHEIVSIDSCFIDNEKSDSIIRTIVKLMKSFKYRPYNEDTGRGFIRHVLVRSAHQTGQYMVILVVGETIFPSKNNFVKALTKEHPEITTIVMNHNNRRTSMVLGEREQVIYGKGYIEDILCGKKFRISSKSFYQINSVQTELLYNTAMEFAALSGTERVIDAYCGIGTIGITASDKAKEVIGIELNKDAVKDAIINSKLNNCKNARFFQGDAGGFMVDAAAAGNKYDVVFMDPPRSGSSTEFINSIGKLKPEKVVYISCGPDTLARDIKLLEKKGYKMKKCILYDLFPWTEHCEAVCLLSRI